MSTILILLVLFAAVLGPAAVIAAIGYSAIRALGRNPSAAPKIFAGMIVLVVFAMGVSIITLLIVFQLFGNK